MHTTNCNNSIFSYPLSLVNTFFPSLRFPAQTLVTIRPQKPSYLSVGYTSLLAALESAGSRCLPCDVLATGGLAHKLDVSDRSERMGHLKPIDFPESNARGNSAAPAAKSYWWIWVLILVIVVGGVWYYRSAHSGTPAGDPPAAGKGGKGGAN